MCRFVRHIWIPTLQAPMLQFALCQLLAAMLAEVCCLATGHMLLGAACHLPANANITLGSVPQPRKKGMSPKALNSPVFRRVGRLVQPQGAVAFRAQGEVSQMARPHCASLTSRTMKKKPHSMMMTTPKKNSNVMVKKMLKASSQVCPPHLALSQTPQRACAQ